MGVATVVGRDANKQVDETKTSSNTWIWIILCILSVIFSIVGGYYIYIKYIQ